MSYTAAETRGAICSKQIKGYIVDGDKNGYKTLGTEISSRVITRTVSDGTIELKIARYDTIPAISKTTLPFISKLVDLTSGKTDYTSVTVFYVEELLQTPTGGATTFP